MEGHDVLIFISQKNFMGEKGSKDVFKIDEILIKLTVFGKDNKFWAGHYGARFTNMFVKLIENDQFAKDRLIQE